MTDETRQYRIDHARKRRQALKAKGLCTYCGQPSDGGTIYCAKHRIENSRKYRDRLATLLRLGLCTRCGKQDAPAGFRTCLACRGVRRRRGKTDRDKQRERDVRRMKRDDHRKRGICTDCDLPAVAGTTLCLHHLAKKRASSERRRAKLRRAGVCITCAKPKQDEDRNYCDACAKRHAGYVAKHRQAAAMKGNHHGSNETEA